MTAMSPEGEPSPEESVLKLADVRVGRQRSSGVADGTPLVPSTLSATFGHELLLKLEVVQPAGAVELRGALSAIATHAHAVAGVAGTRIEV